MVSLVGIVLTCGLLCPVGLVLSLFGLRGEPRGLAIAGTVIGALGSGLLALLLGAVGLGAYGAISGAGTFSSLNADGSLMRAQELVESRMIEDGRAPDDGDGNELLATLTDRFGNALRYERTSDGFLIRSAGPDGLFDNVDDVRAYYVSER